MSSTNTKSIEAKYQEEERQMNQLVMNHLKELEDLRVTFHVALSNKDEATVKHSIHRLLNDFDEPLVFNPKGLTKYTEQ